MKDPKKLRTKETAKELHQGFLQRAERMLMLHKERASVHDGLKHLTDTDLIQKVREGPAKLKRKHKDLLIRLENASVSLDEAGEIKWSSIPHKSVHRFVTDNQVLVKTVLMQKDLEFEYPQKLERKLAKADILKMVEEEEELLRSFMEEPKPEGEGYEEHFGHQGRMPEYGFTASKGETTFEQFVEREASPYMFENDLLEQTFKFWETDKEKFARIQKIWLELRRKNALGGLDAVPVQHHDKTTQAVVRAIRDLRFCLLYTSDAADE